MVGAADGRVIDGRFELIEPLGSGGMGTVWRARDLALQRDVALKEVRPGVSDDSAATPRLRERVMREAQALARLSDRHVVTIHHIVDVEPHPWLVMELIPGANLQTRIDQRGPLDPQPVARIGRQVLSALTAAHSAGVHHRDVKPANVLLRQDGSAVLTDFGIAALQGTSSLTQTGDVIGSPEFMAPERASGDVDEPAADLWSLGMLMYAAVEGRSPMRRPTSMATLAAVLRDPIPTPVRAGALAPVLYALLNRDPAARPTASSLDQMLADVERGMPAAQPGQAAVTSTSRRPAATGTYGVVSRGAGASVGGSSASPVAAHQPPRRRGLLIGVGVLLLALIGGGIIAGLKLSGDDQPAQADGARPATSSSTPPAPTTDRPTTASASPTPSVTTVTTTVSPSTTSPSATSSSATSPSATSSSPSSTSTEGPAPAYDSTWVAQLASVSRSSGVDARNSRLTSIRRKVPSARVVNSDHYASLRPGYWVIIAPGPFADGRAAVRFCERSGLTNTDSCVGRYLSTVGADRVYFCKPAGGGTGRCTRD